MSELPSDDGLSVSELAAVAEPRGSPAGRTRPIKRTRGESARGPLIADARRASPSPRPRSPRDGLLTPSRSIGLGRHASIPGPRPYLLISSAFREAHGVDPRARRSTPPRARASPGSAAIFQRWASSLSKQNRSGGLKIRTTVQFWRAVTGSRRGLSRFDLAATINDEPVGAPLRNSSANRHARARRYVRI